MCEKLMSIPKKGTIMICQTWYTSLNCKSVVIEKARQFHACAFIAIHNQWDLTRMREIDDFFSMTTDLQFIQLWMPSTRVPDSILSQPKPTQSDHVIVTRVTRMNMY